MDFSSRNTQRPTARPAAPTPVAAPVGKKTDKPKTPLGKGVKILGILLFVSALVLSVAAIISISLRSSETDHVNKGGYQVLTLVDQQAYFGKITKITDSYVILQDIYYIQGASSKDNSNTTASNPTLIKRGCEIHRPADQMVVYRDQITFWENLQSNGKVAEGIAQLKKEGQDCDKQQAPQQEAAQQNTDKTTSDTEKKDDSTTPDNATENSTN